MDWKSACLILSRLPLLHEVGTLTPIYKRGRAQRLAELQVHCLENESGNSSPGLAGFQAQVL